MESSLPKQLNVISENIGDIKNGPGSKIAADKTSNFYFFSTLRESIKNTSEESQGSWGQKRSYAWREYKNPNSVKIPACPSLMDSWFMYSAGSLRKKYNLNFLRDVENFRHFEPANFGPSIFVDKYIAKKV